MTASNEPRVSEEDREGAKAAIREYLGGEDIVDALVSHGWRPPSTVTRERIAERLGPAMALNDDLVLLLRECGIELTE